VRPCLTRVHRQGISSSHSRNSYAKAPLFELFNDARAGEEVIIVRADGRSCELTPLAEVKQEETIAIAATIPDEAPSEGDLVPA
jgi:antitoxin (DNA-binding transcriptional repressor) of toxin-antitoxin stability system